MFGFTLPLCTWEAVTPIGRNANSASIAAFLFAFSPLILAGQNAWATTTQSAPVTQISPVIAAQPDSVVVNAGFPATFSIAVSNVGPVTYQWLRNGSPITGANSNVLVVPATLSEDSGARFTVVVKNNNGTIESNVARLTVNATAELAATADRPFNDQSPWNSRPTAFTLDTKEVPKSFYYPTIAIGAYSVKAFVASAKDPAITVYGLTDAAGIWLPDAEAKQSKIVIPHWPTGVVPATGGDGHADIVDVAANRIHSFYQLKQVNGVWRASQYTWTALNGRGFGTPAQYQQGARATGVVPIAGLIRTKELNDSLPVYRHALAMSMASNALAATPSFEFPATNGDGYAASVNTGSIREGALMMLPQTFNLSQIKDTRLLKIVRTLQTYGAYVVDANTGTPFALYVENGSNFNLMPPGVWSSGIANELDLIRAGLRQVTNVTRWVDAKGVTFTPTNDLNLLSMRGYWYVMKGSTAGVFDTWQQAVVFPENGVHTIQINSSGRSMPNVWGAPTPGKVMTMKVSASEGASVKLDLMQNGKVVYSTGTCYDYSTVRFKWPGVKVVPFLTTSSGPSGGGKVSATLVSAP